MFERLFRTVQEEVDAEGELLRSQGLDQDGTNLDLPWKSFLNHPCWAEIRRRYTDYYEVSVGMVLKENDPVKAARLSGHAIAMKDILDVEETLMEQWEDFQQLKKEALARGAEESQDPN